MTKDNLNKCPCCFLRTISELSSYEICPICGWEDDGQNDSNEELVLGGPNKGYSLEEARKNFELLKTMYRLDDSSYPNNEKFISIKDDLIDVLLKLKDGMNSLENETVIEELTTKLLSTPRKAKKC